MAVANGEHSEIILFRKTKFMADGCNSGVYGFCIIYLPTANIHGPHSQWWGSAFTCMAFGASEHGHVLFCQSLPWHCTCAFSLSTQFTQFASKRGACKADGEHGIARESIETKTTIMLGPHELTSCIDQEIRTRWAPAYIVCGSECVHVSGIMAWTTMAYLRDCSINGT